MTFFVLLKKLSILSKFICITIEVVIIVRSFLCYKCIQASDLHGNVAILC